ncbi:protein-export membrane protein SecF [Mycolicibacterium cyprinidarum]|uniref:Protein-export membrane protein SecF n=1 Tax=Mycolicibacterium cyprinidarum TaxID=2860311 RepID=A0ABQ4V6M2_9MYCO|nr:protein-export membrane protein SecF [Mycolicibacterium sp. NGTWS0302]GJF08811.1 protein-export membrane protein SecF [Mycolicibacterium sp. NGTWSNA01]GJF09994.1 protein-export membrane protein SecF [Mycolicibacterium sp. NGTWS1803]
MAAKHHRSETATSGAVEVSDLESTATSAPRHGFFVRLYTGTGAFEVMGQRKIWYAVSAIIVAVAVGAIVFRGFTFGIDFEGGTKVSFPRGDGQATAQQVETVFSDTIGEAPESVVIVGSGDSATFQIRSETLSNEQTEELRTALFDKFQPVGSDGQPGKQAISDSAVSETWGGQITQKAIVALVVFLVLASIYITVRYERYMAIAALTTLVFDIVVTAGVYALVGFEVTPATVIGLLTILGFSLYDTVIVFDKVEENVEGFEHTTRRTFAEQANLAVNQTFMRSINTSLISVLPIIALMVIAVWLLGVGTLMDLALVQLVGVIVGTYSSIFFATPLLVSLRERTDLVRKHTNRVLSRRKTAAARATGAEAQNDDDEDLDSEAASVPVPATPVPDKPMPGARPVRPSRSRTGRPSGSRNSGKR